MPLGTFIAGRYSGTFNSADVGITADPGFELQQTSHADVLNNTDAYGMSIIDWSYQGGDVFLQWTAREYKAPNLAAFWPWGSLGVMANAAAPIGRLASDVAKAMVLSATSNTPAANAPATMTAQKAILAPSYPAGMLFSSKLRTVPVRLQLLPYAEAGYGGAGGTIWFQLS